MSRVVFRTLIVSAVLVVLLGLFRLDSPMGWTQVQPGPDGRGQRATWPKQVGTAPVVLGQLTAQHVPFSAGFPFLQRTASAHGADDFQAPSPGSEEMTPIMIDYPAEGSIFPPEITPPRFVWRDAADGNTVWLIKFTFSDGSADIEARSRGERLHIGEIDPRCIAESNKLPELTPEQAAAWSWRPDVATWETIKKRCLERPATVTITGFRDEKATQAVSRGQCTIATSKDPVGAPIFYRDVPLIPALGEKGMIKPLPESAIHLIKWRLRSVGDTESRTMMEELPTCANCHSFSRDGKTLGMDVDGPQNDKGLYSLTPIQPITSIRSENIIRWTSFRALADSDNIRVGFMSQVSPDGRHVVTMINDPSPRESSLQVRRQDRIYVANFNDYRFGQVFFPTRGILAWYDREARQLRPLPGADDPHYVQTAGFWSPDGKYIVFERAEAKIPFPPDAMPPKFAEDPNEIQVRYDLYRIPFNNGQGGVAEPIEGASRDGMSNNFPKVSPDGRWIVFVKCRNGQLLRPDSKLWIVPFQGGQAREMKCNMSLMNSWHSFSPNGRWMVFSSKSHSPYTEMFLTHLDEDGKDSPAILVENTTLANRAVNIPEFVNVAPGEFTKLDAPVTNFYRVFNQAAEMEDKRQYAAAMAEWQKALELDPLDAKANFNFGLALARTGKLDDAILHFQKAVDTNPDFAIAHNNLGIALAQRGKVDGALAHFQKAVELEPNYGDAHMNFGAFLLQSGRPGDALAQFQKAVEIEPGFADAQDNLGIALLQTGKVDEAIPHFQKAVELKPDFGDAQENLGIALLQTGKADEATPHLLKGLEADPKQAQAYYNLGGALFVQGKVKEALARWREGLRQDPNNLPLLNQIAWVLATFPEASLRNGREAVELGERAVKASAGPDPVLFDTLAAAYAEAGRFPEAVRTAHQALDLATQQNAQPLMDGLRVRIAAYASHSPFRDRQ